MRIDERIRETRLLKQIWSGVGKPIPVGGAEHWQAEPEIHWGEEEGLGTGFSYILNPTGGLRWIFPSEQAFPVHLSLYNSAHWRARAYKLATHLAFKFGQDHRVVSGRFHMKGLDQTPLGQTLTAFPNDGYAIFTGTVGENRKAILALNQGKDTTHFAKLPLSPRSQELISNEAAILARLEAFQFQYLKVPKVQLLPRVGGALLSNAKPPHGREGNRLEVRHLQALTELYDRTRTTETLGSLSFYQEIQDCLERIETLEVQDESIDTNQVRNIATKLRLQWRKLDPEAELTVAWAHCDFTSWNMYLSDKALHVYDWELAREAMPLLYDAFHYLYQTGVLLLQQPYYRIKRELLRAYRLPGMDRLLRQNGLDFEAQHRLYLLHMISYYLRIYMDEPEVHMQVHWLLETWEDALEKW